MSRRLHSTRLLQVGLLVLLVVSFAQVIWWVLDEAAYTARVRDRRLAEERRDADVANRLLATGLGAGKVAELFPELEQDASARFAVPAARASEIADERWHRINRYGWEGSFFLLVLGAGMGILIAALRLEASLRRRHQNFLASISHDFKTPLASMRLTTETLVLRDPPAERRTELYGRILDDLGRLETMVTNLLDTARLEAARAHYRPEPVPLRPAVEAAIRRFAARAERHGVELEATIDPALEVQADPLAVQSVLDNLIDNALTAVGGRDDGKVCIGARRLDQWVQVEVADNGVGFAPGDGARLFDKFYSLARETSRSRGSGLGLYVVRRLVEMGGGRIEATSSGAGSGAHFRVCWPPTAKGAA